MGKNTSGIAGGSEKEIQFHDSNETLNGIPCLSTGYVLTSRGASLNPTFQALTNGSVTVDTDAALTADSDALIASQKATKAYADTKLASSVLDTDAGLAADSDAKVPSQKAVKAYADAILTPPIDFSALTPGSETYGSAITTKTTWISFGTAGACGIKLLLENTCDTGEFATLRLRARANNTTGAGNGGSSVGTTTCADFSASAIDHEYGVLKAVNAIAQPNDKNQTQDATNIVTALYGRIDATGTSVGRRWVSWIDTHATSKADAGDYMQRISHNGTVANDGCFTIYTGGRLPVLFNFEDIAGFLSASASGTFTKTHKIAVTIAGVGTRYIELGTIA